MQSQPELPCRIPVPGYILLLIGQQDGHVIPIYYILLWAALGDAVDEVGTEATI